MNPRTNAGYTITDSIHVGDTEIVLGVNDHQPAMFVTWQCTDGNSYFWGHYHDDPLKAQKDLIDRAGQEMKLQMAWRARAAQINVGPNEEERQL